ncbi:MAG: hypothetical protein J4G10_05065 [Alphaproteobacteria bacterium]|nr:hypothetical protein [Alphaproteobacteria bacterium]
MFDRKTVIVLGAGASAPFGFPLGAQLRVNLIAGIGQLKNRLTNEEFMLQPVGAHNVDIFWNDPFGALASYIKGSLGQPHLPENISQDSFMHQLYDFHKYIKRQTQDTLDQFIRENPSYNFIGKVLLSQQVMVGMYEKDEDCLCLKSFAEGKINGRRIWYQQLINLIRRGAQNTEELLNNKLDIVTFNYDHSLERALDTSLGDTEIHQGADYREVVNIFHVNGSPSELPKTVSDVGKFILECAKDFHLVEEKAASHVHAARERSQRAVFDAERSYVMGFDFDPSNVSAIGLQKTPQKEGVFCLNFNGHLGLRQRIERLNIPYNKDFSGTPNNPLHIYEAIGNGFLEQ